MQDTMHVNGVEYRIVRLLGHGKGGYSYLAEKDGRQYVLKQIHHEPCAYYTFGNKIEAERHDYARLTEAGIRVPKLLDIDVTEERILKEYVDGPTVFDLVKEDCMHPSYLGEVRCMASLAQKAGLNIDYFPTNFVACDGVLYYVDYECNPYMEEWNFENWGIQYWSKTDAFLAHLTRNGR